MERRHCHGLRSFAAAATLKARCGLTLQQAMRAAPVSVLACLPLHTFADAKAGENKAQLCIVCHKPAPDKRFVPLLEQQPAEYLVTAITAFKTRQRIETSMNVNAANLSDADIRDIADYFASKEFPIRTQNLDLATEHMMAAARTSGMRAWHATPQTLHSFIVEW